MPRLVKGGKWIYGLSRVSETGRFVVPAGAATEYGFHPGDKLIVMSGSAASGGFGLTTIKTLKKANLSRLAGAATGIPLNGVHIVQSGGRLLARTALDKESCVLLNPVVMERFGVKPGDTLAVARGSYLAMNFIVRGPIIEEALQHPELTVYCCKGRT